MAEEYVEEWADLSVAELREELKARELPTTGNKPDLVARLEADDEKRDAEEAAGAEQPADRPESAGDPPKDEDPAETADPAPEGASSQENNAEGTGETDEGQEVPGVFVAEVPLPEDADSHFDLEDPDFRAARLEARQQAVNAGCTPLGDAYSARFAGESNGVMRFEVPLR